MSGVEARAREAELLTKRREFQAEVRSVAACPLCQARIDACCIEPDGTARDANHRERIEVWSSRTGKVYYDAWQRRRDAAVARKKRSRFRGWNA